MLAVLAGITLVLTFAFAVTAVMRGASSASRHVVWTCAVTAVLLIAPLRWRVPQHVYAPILPAVTTTPIFATSTPAAPALEFSGIKPAQVVTGIWVAGTLLLLIRLLRNALQLHSIVRAAKGTHPVLTTPSIQGPLVTGILRPAILLPAESASWNTARRRAVIAHEAAHIRRRDPLILFAAQIATAIYWFHPLVWLVVAKLRAESECACDDAALSLGLLPSSYAGHLLDLARKFNTQLAIPMATTTHLESRVKSILDPKTNRSFPARRTWFGALGATAVILFALSSVSLSAQSTTGVSGIAGTVTDPSGAVVPNAAIRATNIDLNTTDTAYSRADGSYAFTTLAPGHYSLSVMVPGFAVFRAESLDLPAGKTIQVSARLNVGSIKQAVQVAGRGTPRPEASQSAVPARVRVGGMVQAANLISQTRPVYPPDLMAEGVEGVVKLQAIIGKDGSIQSLSSISGSVNQGLVAAAMDAVKQWRYKPTLLNGEPIEVMTTIDVSFTLTQ
ncbi:MAG TPA: M56 family metallopeptidase [Bryobacteraceae bacterium]|nr:M56 family metallopeptidase [Bryobacteraceae bacterium]